MTLLGRCSRVTDNGRAAAVERLNVLIQDRDYHVEPPDPRVSLRWLPTLLAGRIQITRTAPDEMTARPRGASAALVGATPS